MHGLDWMACDFCDVAAFHGAELFVENDLCVYASTVTPGDGLLPGSGLAVARAHRESPFELTSDEWVATRSVLLRPRH